MTPIQVPGPYRRRGSNHGPGRAGVHIPNRRVNSYIRDNRFPYNNRRFFHSRDPVPGGRFYLLSACGTSCFIFCSLTMAAPAFPAPAAIAFLRGAKITQIPGGSHDTAYDVNSLHDQDALEEAGTTAANDGNYAFVM